MLYAYWDKATKKGRLFVLLFLLRGYSVMKFGKSSF